MKLPGTLAKTFFLVFVTFAFTAKVNRSHAQRLLAYDSASNGAIAMVAAHVTSDTTLKRVNGAMKLSPPCTHGFSTKNFDTGILYFDTLAAVEIWLAADSGYFLKVDSFNVDLRRSTTGPRNARFAYSVDTGSIDSGLTWVNQGTDQFPFSSATCDSMDTCTWRTSFKVAYPKKLWFRVYGFNCNTTAGTGNLQIMNLIINGSVPTAATLLVPEEHADANSFQVYPNPVSQNANFSYHLSKERRVTMSICNVVGQEVTRVVNNVVQQPGDYNYSIPVTAPGIYFVKLSTGDDTITRKIVKM